MALNNRILISRTDSLGDVILTLPMLGIIKNRFPKTKIFFLAKNYAKPIINATNNVDEFISFDDLEKLSSNKQVELLRQLKIDTIIHVFPNKLIAILAKKARIRLRIGTSHRLYHWSTCNTLVKLGRKNSQLHEAQLNIKLLKPLGINISYKLNELYKFYGFAKIKELGLDYSNLLSKEKKNIILHPKSKGSAREWGLENFQQLINLLPKTEYKIFVTGTQGEGDLMREFLSNNIGKIINLTGRMSLDELVSFISKCDALVAASTGPLHIAAATGIRAIGIFAPMRPIHPGRWMPIGKNATHIVKEEYCNNCRKLEVCKCIIDITPKQILDKI